MSTAEAWTVGRLLTWTAEYLKKHGSSSPRLDAEVLLAAARGCQRIELYTAFDEEPPEEVRAAFKEMVRRRAEGTPVAYLVGHKEFYSLSFEVNPDVLIPRPETEHLVVEAIDRVKKRGGQGAEVTIADVGTGSGCIAVALAKSLPASRIWALDSSPAALAVAARNVDKHGVAEQVQLLESDLLSATDPQQFDLIVSNPPYITEAEYAGLPVSVRDHEPRSALVGGPQGTEVISRLLEQAATRLKPGGSLLIEFSPTIVDGVAASIDRALWSEPTIIKDLAGHARIIAVDRSQQ